MIRDSTGMFCGMFDPEAVFRHRYSGPIRVGMKFFFFRRRSLTSDLLLFGFIQNEHPRSYLCYRSHKETDLAPASEMLKDSYEGSVCSSRFCRTLVANFLEAANRTSPWAGLRLRVEHDEVGYRARGRSERG